MIIVYLNAHSLYSYLPSMIYHGRASSLYNYPLTINLPETKFSRKRETHMKKDVRALTFIEKENICEREFKMAGEFWHLFTDGTKMEDIFLSEEEFELGETLLAVSCCKIPEVKTVTFELMKNHLHMILNGKREQCMMLFEDYEKRLRRVMKHKGKTINWDNFQADILPIETLKALRNEIIYTNRNAFVANPNVIPSNYPWGCGYAYFNMMTKHFATRNVADMSFDDQRRLTHCRDIKGLGKLQAVDHMGILVTSFCDISLGERMFQDARSYFNALTRNAEAFSQIAERLKDTIFLTDDELYQVAVKYSESHFDSRNLSILSGEQKIQLAKELHFKYKATNQQIRRILRLELSILNEMFP